MRNSIKTETLIIFDLDGVLIDSEPLMRLAFRHSYKAIYGSGKAPVDEYLDHMGKPFDEIMRLMGLSSCLHEHYSNFCSKRMELVQIFPYTYQLLPTLRTYRCKLGLLTGKDRDRTMTILNKFGITQHFDYIVTGDDPLLSKPNPDGINYMLINASIAASKAVMVGDSVADMDCARLAGVSGIAVTWGTKPEKLRQLTGSHTLCESWSQLQLMLQSHIEKYHLSRVNVQ